MRTIKHWALAAAAAAALALAGCGGGGSSTSGGPGTVVPAPTPAEQLAAAKTAVEEATAAVNAATTAAERAAAYAQLAAAEQKLAEVEALPDNVIAGLRSEIDDLKQQIADVQSDYDDARDAATKLRAAIDAVQAAEMAAGALGADASQADIDAADALVMAAQTAVDALSAADQARLQGQVDDADGMVMAAQSMLDNAATVAANTKAAATKATAIAAEAAQTTDAGLGGSDATIGTGDGNYELTSIKRDRMDTTVTVTVHGATDADDEKFMQAMDLGGGTNMLTRTMDADDDGNVMQEVVVITTDIEAPTAVAFADFESDAAGTKSQGLTVRADGETVSDDDPADSFALGASPDATIRGHVESSAFTSGTAAQLTFGGDDPGDDTDAAFTASGTYNGAMGTYMCAGGATDCTVTLDADGMITAMSDGWIFTPDMGATSDQPDYEYLHYGFWLKKTTDADGAVTYNEVETFAGATGLAASGDVSAVEGTASYTGGATGVYVHHVYSQGGGSVMSSTSGHFTADASLMIAFGGNDVAVNDQNRLTGTIDNFMLSGGEMNDWSVALESDGDPNTAGIQPDTDGVYAGTAKGGDGDGSFSATLHGDVTAVDGVVPQPAAVVGEFNAGFSNGSVAGAFGATKD